MNSAINKYKTDEELFKEMYDSADCPDIVDYIESLDKEWYPVKTKTRFQSLTPTKDKLYSTVIQFMKDQDVTCEETIHQMDNVIEAAYDFMTDLFNIVKDDLDLEEDE